MPKAAKKVNPRDRSGMKPRPEHLTAFNAFIEWTCTLPADREQKTIKAFSEAHNISDKTVYNWRYSKLYQDGIEQLMQDLKRTHGVEIRNALVRACVENLNPAAIKLYEQVVNGWSEKSTQDINVKMPPADRLAQVVFKALKDKQDK